MNAFKSNPAFAINLDPGLQTWKLAGAGPDLGTQIVAARIAYSDAQENRAPMFKVSAGGDRFGDAIRDEAGKSPDVSESSLQQRIPFPRPGFPDPRSVYRFDLI